MKKSSVTKKVYQNRDGNLTFDRIETIIENNQKRPTRFDAAKALYANGQLERDPETANWKKMIKNLSKKDKFKNQYQLMQRQWEQNSKTTQRENNYVNTTTFFLDDRVQSEQLVANAVTAYIGGLKMIHHEGKYPVVTGFEIN